MNILITGATGYIGSRILAVFSSKYDLNLTAAVRRNFSFPNVKIVNIKSINKNTDWSKALKGKDVVIHLAASIDSKNDKGCFLTEKQRSVNLDGTLNLAAQAASMGVKRFIFLSSIKVHGEESMKTTPFRPDNVPIPKSGYGLSKLKAEQGLDVISKKTGMEIVKLRPSLVYGPMVKGNFEKLVRLASLGLPLPLASIKNKRSFLALDNLVDLIFVCLSHPNAANEVFLVSDKRSLSTPELISITSSFLKKPSILFPFPVSILILISFLFGKSSQAKRLTSSLEADISKLKELLDWQPSLSVEQGIKLCLEN